MKFENLVAARYLWMARRRAHSAFLTLISMLGLAIGVFALLFSLALLGGLQNQIKERLMASSPQLLIDPAGSPVLNDWPGILTELRRLGMARAYPVLSGLAWGANPTQRRGRPLRIRSSGDVAVAPGHLLLTRDFAASIGMSLGQTLVIVSPRTRLTPFGPAPIIRSFTVDSVNMTPGRDATADTLLALDDVEGLFGVDGPNSIEAFGSESRAEEIQPLLARRYPAALVKTWKEINHPLFLALRLEKIVMFATISLIIFVAALNLISSISMLIMEKRPQVGILRTLGATDRSILSLFMRTGLFIGLSGTLLGNILGIGLAWAANRWHLVPLPRDVYFTSYLPFRIEWSDVLAVNLIAIGLSVVATWYPARTAARLDPVAAIRD